MEIAAGSTGVSGQSAHDPRTSYDAVADDYTARVAAELQHKPFDRLFLDQFAERVRDFGWVADIGCGPGHVACYLHDRGVRVVGIDLSPRMIECARKLHPTIEFQQTDMEALPVPNETWAGLVAFYSLIHVPRERVVATLREFRRVLRPRGLLLLAFHIGAEVVHLDEWWNHRVSIDFVFFRSDEVEGYLTTAGFEVERSTERDPYPPEVEHQSRRGYIVARVVAT
jgi:SAM-dependent methyltransferase